MEMNGIPIIELKVQGMEHNIVAALQEHEAEISSEIQEAMKKVCSPENIQATVRAEVGRAFTQVIFASIMDIFRKNSGAITNIVEELIIQALKGKRESRHTGRRKPILQRFSDRLTSL